MPERPSTPRRTFRFPATGRAFAGLVALLLGVPCAAFAQAAAEDASPGGATPEALVAACPGLTATTTEVNVAGARALLLCALNAERAAAGLPPLEPATTLTAAAQDHTKIMVAAGALEHGDLPVLLRAYTRGYGVRLGENVGETGGRNTTIADMVGAWMRSFSHRTNILDPGFRDVGIGVLLTSVDGGPGATYTTDFGARRALATRRASLRRRAATVRRRHN